MMLDYHLVSGYQKLQQKLLSPEFADRLDKPLAFWALPADRHLPLALIGRSLQELLAEPFEEIYGTPGIGPKKISTLLKLLNRAAQPLPPGAIPPPQDEVLEREPETTPQRRGDGTVDVRSVSEALWISWRDGVRDFGLGDATLGRFAISLQRLPRVLWSTPLSAYLELSLSEIRQLRTHGEKRVRAVLEVFGTLHQIVAHLGSQEGLAVRIAPAKIVSVETWIASALLRPTAPGQEELHQKLIEPLLEQLRLDGGEQVEGVLRARINPANLSVQQAGKRFGLTRARIYEMLSEAPTLLGIRWPEGKFVLGALRNHVVELAPNSDALGLLAAAGAAFFGVGADEAGAAAPEAAASA